MFRELLTGWIFATLLIPAQGLPPDWWQTRDAVAQNVQGDDYAVLNQGQLKNLAKAAVEEMNARLPHGAGVTLNQMLSSWQTETRTADDFAVVSLRQLKMVAKAIYQRLENAAVISSLPSWIADLPSTKEDDKAVANIGQAKNLFSFAVPDQVTDSDGDGFTDHEEGIAGTNPNLSSNHPALPSSGPTQTDLPAGQPKVWPVYENPTVWFGSEYARVIYNCKLSKTWSDPADLNGDAAQFKNRFRSISNGINLSDSEMQVSFLSASPSYMTLATYPITLGGGSFYSRHSRSAPYADNFFIEYNEQRTYSKSDLYVRPAMNFSVNPPRTASMIKLFIQVPDGTSNAIPDSTGIKQYVTLPSVPLVPDGQGGYLQPEFRLANSTLFANPPQATPATSLQPGETKSVGFKWQEIPFDILSFSLADSTGPRYRKIGLNGFPLSDSKPQNQDESGELPEETYVDAYNRQVRHSVSDVYTRLDSSLLPLQVRRSVTPESWSRRFGLTIAEKMDRPFGPGWSSNLAPIIRFEGNEGGFLTNLQKSARAVVTDEQGGQRTFFRVKGSGIWSSSREQTQDAKTLFDRFVEGPNNTYILHQKYGTRCIYQKITGLHLYGRNKDEKLDPSITGFSYYHYARLIEVHDRLGNKMCYSYQDRKDENDVVIDPSLVPHLIYDPERPSHKISIQQDEGLIVKVQGPDGELIHYEYEDVVSPGVAPLPASFKVLKSVRRSAPGSAPPVSGGVAYSYDVVTDVDPTPDASDGIQTEYVHVELQKITNERGHAYEFSYRDPVNSESRFDRGWLSEHKTGDPQNILRSQVGLPRLLTQIKLPADEGAAARVVNFSGTRGATISLMGQVTNAHCQTTVSSDTGTFHYVFSKPEVFRPYIEHYTGHVEFLDHQRSLSFTELQIYHGEVVGPNTPKEIFEFNPQAGMALKKVTDLDKKVTRYNYASPAVLYQPPSNSQTKSQSIYFDDPTEEISAIHGKMSQGKPVNGRKVFTYDAATRVMTSMTDAAGIKTSYVLKQPPEGYLPTGLRTKETVTDTRVTPAKVLRVTDFEYGHSRFKGFMTRQIVRTTGLPAEASGAASEMITEFDPDLNGRVRTQTVKMGQSDDLITRYDYTSGGMKKAVTDPRSLTTFFEYEPDTRRLKKVVHPDGSFKQIHYDAAGNVDREINEIGVTVFHDYDVLNRKLKTTVDLNGNGVRDARYTSYTPASGELPAAYNGDIVTESAYNSFNLPEDEWDARGYRTHHDYDELGRRTQTTVNFGSSDPELIQVTRYVDDDPGTSDFVGGSVFDISGFKPKQVTDPRGFVTRFEYDDLYRVTKKTLVDTTYPEGNPARLVEATTLYDEVGNAILQKDPLNRSTVTEYDGLGRATRVIYPGDAQTPVSNTLSFYTPAGQVWKTVDEMGAVTRHFYDDAGRQIRTVLPAVLNHLTGTQMSPQVHQSFDANGNVIKVQDPLGNVTETIYDQRNRPWKVRHPLVADAATGLMKHPVTVTNYDPSGRAWGASDPLGNFTETKYDRAGRALQVIAPPVGDNIHITSSSYDPAGNVLTVTNAKDQTVTNVYDELGRLRKTTDAEEIPNEFGYDKAGNRTRVQDGLLHETTFVYDGQNRLIEQVYENDDAWTFVYDALNKTGQTDAKNVLTSYAYDVRNRLRSLSSPDQNRIHAYDRAGRLLSVTEAGRPEANVGYTYDAQGRVLTEISHGIQHTYGYDLAGNRVQAAYGTGRTVTTTYDALNRPSTITENGRMTSYGYDLAGRALVLIAGNEQATENVYDALGRLTSRKLFASMSDRSDTGVLAKFDWEHDAISNVTEHQEEWKANASRPAGLRTTTMSYDMVNRLEEEVVSHSGNQTKTTYTYDEAHNRKTKLVEGGADPGHWDYVYNEVNQLETWTKRDAPNGTLQKSAGLAYDANGNRTHLELVDQTATDARASLANQGITYQSKTAGAAGEDLSVTLETGTALASRIENGGDVVVTLAAGAPSADSLVNQGITYTTVNPHQSGQDVTLSLVAEAPDQTPGVIVDGQDVTVRLGTNSGAAAAASNQGIIFQAKDVGTEGNTLKVRLEKQVVGELASASVEGGQDVVVKMATTAGTPDKLQHQGMTFTALEHHQPGQEVVVSLVADEAGQELDFNVSENHLQVFLETDLGAKATTVNQGVTYTSVEAGPEGNNVTIDLQEADANEALSASNQENSIVVRLPNEKVKTASLVLGEAIYTSVEPGVVGNTITVSHIAAEPDQSLEVTTNDRHVAIKLATDSGDHASLTLYNGLKIDAVTPGVQGNNITILTENRGTPGLELEAFMGSEYVVQVRSATDGEGNCTSTVADIGAAIQSVASHLVAVTVDPTVASIIIDTGHNMLLTGGGENFNITSTYSDVYSVIQQDAVASSLIEIGGSLSGLSIAGTGMLTGGAELTFLATGSQVVQLLASNGTISSFISVTDGNGQILEPTLIKLSDGGSNVKIMTDTADLIELLSGQTSVENLVSFSSSENEQLKALPPTALSGGVSSSVISTTAEIVELLGDLQPNLPISVTGGSEEVTAQPGIIQLSGGGEGFETTSTVTAVVGLLTAIGSPAADLITAAGTGGALVQPLPRTVLTGGAAPILTTADEVVTLLTGHSLVNVTGGGGHPLSPLPRTQLTGVSSSTFSTSYAWNSQDRLVGVTMPDGSAHSYTYDYRVRRLQTSRTAGSLPAQTTAIVFAGGLSLAEYDSATPAPFTPGSPTVHYLRGPDMGGGVGGMLYSIRDGDTLRYSLSNGRGDIIAQSDENATLTWTASYEAFGKRPTETGVNLDKQRASSKDEDPTGLLNEGFRYRDLETGVWLSRDPAGFVDGPNLYAYVKQNPWTSFDPDGLRACGGPMPARKTPPSSAEQIFMGAYGAVLSIPSGPALLTAMPQRTVSAIATQAKADYKDGGGVGVFNRYNPIANIVGGVVGFDPVNGSPLGLQERSQSVTGGLLGLYGTTQAGVALTNKVAGALVKAPPPTAPTLGAKVTGAVAAAEAEAAAANTAGRTNAQLVQDIATRAEAWGTRQGIPAAGSGPVQGTLKHGYAERLLDRYQSLYGSRGLQTEASYLNGQAVPYRTKGSVRLDVYEPSTGSVWDYKFTPNPSLPASRVQRIINNGPAGINSVDAVGP
ncbi:MAG: RHS repeat-associated core domain-containing protein [Verrucomicrobiota bacterium]